MSYIKLQKYRGKRLIAMSGRGFVFAERLKGELPTEKRITHSVAEFLRVAHYNVKPPCKV